jgi:hypothetical protein
MKHEQKKGGYNINDNVGVKQLMFSRRPESSRLHRYNLLPVCHEVLSQGYVQSRYQPVNPR